MKIIGLKIIFLVFCLFGLKAFASITEEESLVYYQEGISLYKKSDYVSAENAFLKSIEATDSINNERLAKSYHFLGNIESWKSNFARSIQYHKKARYLFQQLDNIEFVAISNNSLSFLFESLGEYDSTIVYYKKNITNRDQFNNDHVTKRTLIFLKKKTTNSNQFNFDIIFNSYQGIAALYAKLHNYREAYSYLQEGIEYAEKTGNKLSLAKLYFTAGNLFLNNHVNKDIALEYLLEAQDLFTVLNDFNYLNYVKLSIGDVYFKTGNDSLAMHFYKEASTSFYPDNYSAISATNHKIGMVYKRRQEYDSALFYLQKSIDNMCIVCPEIQIYSTLVEAGRLYLMMDNKTQALVYLNRARIIAEESKSGMEMVTSSEELAKYYQSNQQNDSAIYYLKNAYQQAKELGLLQRMKTTAESLSAIYYSRNEFKTASDYLKISTQMNDSLVSIEKYNEIAKLEMRFEIERKEKERLLESQLLQSEITKQKLIRNTSILGTLIFIVILILLLKAYRRKQKDNHLLAKQKKEIQEISKKLQESSQRKLDFFTNISHEIRTPLTLIKAPLERMLKTDSMDPQMNTQLLTALKNTNKLKELLNQILDLQKLDENILGLDVSDFELIAFCQEIVSSFEGYCFQSHCRLIFKSNIAEAMVRFDQIRLRSIINNLLSNAFKYNKPGGWVQFNLEVNAHQINIEIKDNGIGISNEHLTKLGERYFQIEQTNASIEGTGIGLAYVKELLQLMKGSIEFSSIENEGTSVNISLPCDTLKIENEQAVSLEIKAREEVLNNLEERITDDVDGPRILIIEDNVELRFFLRDLFAPTYQVICAKDGQEGKELALKYIPDLIISDIMMPAIKGNELCKMLKNDINTSHITIILFTAQGSPDSIVDGYDCGADDYIIKPFDTEVLLKKVQNIIATSANARKQFSFTDMDRSSSVYSEFDKKFIKDCMSIIKNNIDNSHFTVEFLAEKMSLHRRTLLRKFKALTDKSPTDLIRHSRMSKAAVLIKANYRVNEVALMVGYEDSSRFSKAFKQFHGVTPSAYLNA